jgi:hypothetical protein
MKTELSRTDRHCGYCGHPVSPDSAMPERFGEVFCSGAHAEDFTAGVRAARIEAVASRERNAACAQPASHAGWRTFLGRAACWGGPLLVVLAIPLFWAGGWAAAGGSLVSVLALLACPLGMYLMMSVPRPRDEASTSKGEKHA